MNMRENLMKLFYEKGYFKLASRIWFWLSIAFFIMTIIYFFKYADNRMYFPTFVKYLFASIISFLLHKFLSNKKREMWWRTYNATKI